MTDSERESLAAAIKQDAAAKELSAADEDDDDDDDSTSDDEVDDLYTQETVDFLLDLANHTYDGEWHTENQDVYKRVLKAPTYALIERLRRDTVAALDSGVAATKRNASVLKKNDYGGGGYYDHYWAAFYDPEQSSKTKSCQLFFWMSAEYSEFRYGFAFGNHCDNYIVNLHSAIAANRISVQEYLIDAPEGTVVLVGTSDGEEGINPSLFAAQIAQTENESAEPVVSAAAPISVIQRFPIEQLPDRAESLHVEIGKFFQWVWPFFDAARTGTWSAQPLTIVDDDDDEDNPIDEDAPRTLAQLSDASALSIPRLQEIEDALLTKQQIVLTGPPGTSKTFVAQLFARYFAADRETNSQGEYSTLFMHANWAYEDFFEGIKPYTEDGVLKFAPRLGFFLEWIESLARYRPDARHVLVLDELNRCDTAAVLGELLQLLEYRGRSMRLLSGRTFRFPSNVYIIGTMNSADRSIGRLDLALRRRFLWMDLIPDYDILRTWLSRTGNNPAGFSADALRQCNQLLEDRGIEPEQQVGHALFMLQTFGSETQTPEDKPLIAPALKRIVRFSVLPYVKELCVMQFGRTDRSLIQQIESVLLECLGPVTNQHEPEG